MEISAATREKREARYAEWLNGEGIEFKSPETEAKYKGSIQRFIDCIELEKTPDRVPLFPLGTFMQADLYGITPKEAMYDYPKMLDTQKRFVLDYDPDFYQSPAFIGPGKVFDTIGFNMYQWPGGGGLPDNYGFQCVEDEYMAADDYDWLIRDPSDYFLRKFLPRTCDKLAPLAALSPFTNIWEIVTVGPSMISFGIPDVQEALKVMIEAGNEAMNWIGQIGAFEADIRAHGYPTGVGGACKAPYDMLADTLRGTRGIMMDLYRQPDNVIKAMERFVPICIEQGVSMANDAKNPMVFMPLHKGADAFMSDEQFKKFYWPTFKAVLEGLIEVGCVPFLFCEGGFNSRLEYLKELPKASTFWLFDRTDMATAKKEIGDKQCIGGNMPAGLLLTGKPQAVKDYCKELIDVCGKGGGYVMAFGTAVDEGNAENFHAMFDYTKEYGVY